ncbi:rRNA-processing protein utp23 [Camellia lanceoleosa]|uniref:rRNA-processing protein utp23 n=1 Tax=Camellia lanceoleosa TaxID=1840588 RepID=A0ACC0HC34_9ERIC|nr:rRNA-processing protein utp23 [Camellia lanceoleosa]
MRLKKQKRHRKVVRFYTACFGFREPFKVLCDGTFVHHLHVNSVTPANTALSSILNATVKIFTTRCDHEKRKSAVACIMEIIGEDNPEHFFVATQDADLRKNLREVPGVPVIFGLRNALLLEPPSAFQHQFAKSTEEERSHMTEFEYKMLRMKKKNMLAMEEARESSDVNGSEGDLGTLAVMKTNIGKNGTEVKDKVQFKRKKAKGPNPLSCKKKKNCGHAKENLVSEKVEVNESSSSTIEERPLKISKKSYNNFINCGMPSNNHSPVVEEQKRVTPSGTNPLHN